MILLIDGYNLVKHGLAKSRITPNEKKQFLDTLGRYVKRKKHEVVLVFDGGDNMYPFKEKEHGMSIWYSGYNQCADSLIKKFLRKYKNFDTLLVSSDRELQDCAKRAGIESVTAMYFYNKITGEVFDQLSEVASDQVQKLHADSDKEVDDLMRLASENVIDKDYLLDRENDSKNILRHKEPKGSSFKESKDQRKKNRKLEKL
ncbi:hypothetical protein HN446_00115 [bacterium]|jgi:predicted RNA-binding protein with PIN domain|nr:hypothetical protein [bacterium]